MDTPAVHAPSRKEAAGFLLALAAVWFVALACFGGLVLASQVIAVMAGAVLIAVTILAIAVCVVTLILGPMP